MILLVNGPFGVGKTTVARLLRPRLGRAVIFDPEQIGWVMQRVLRMRGDYQERGAWRHATIRGVRAARVVWPVVIVPMTLWRREITGEIASGLAAVDRVVAVRLLASPPVLRARIEAGDPAARAWRLAHVDRCTRAIAEEAWGVAVPTDGRSPAEVAAAIVALTR